MKAKTIILLALSLLALVVKTSAQTNQWTNVSGKVWAMDDEKIILSNANVDRSRGGDGYIAVENYFGSTEPTSGKHLSFRAKKVGIYTWNSIPISLWDCSTNEPPKPVVYVPPPIPLTSEQIKAIAAQNKKEKQAGEAAALKWNQSQADKGDDYGELRMGERYLKGNGVEKDLAKAKDYFSKSAAQGNLDASNALVKINLASTNAISAGAP